MCSVAGLRDSVRRVARFMAWFPFAAMAVRGSVCNSGRAWLAALAEKRISPLRDGR